ncbi:hypothetical protein IC575_001456 [Cucumis melo]
MNNIGLQFAGILLGNFLVTLKEAFNAKLNVWLCPLWKKKIKNTRVQMGFLVWLS